MQHMTTEVHMRGLLFRWLRCMAGGCLAAVLFASVAGCGMKGLEVQFVEGRVTLDGEPLGNATIGFTCTEKPEVPPAYAVTDENGIYRLTSVGEKHGKGAVVGTFVVNVTKFETEEYEVGEGGTPIGPPPEVRRITPEIYGEPATSPLRATVQQGKNVGAEFDFALESTSHNKP